MLFALALPVMPALLGCHGRASDERDTLDTGPAFPPAVGPSESNDGLDVKDVSAGDGSVIESEAMIAVAPDGRLCAVWQAIGEDSHPAGYAFSDDRGATWTTPAYLSGTDGRIVGDVWVAAGPDGSFWLVGLQIDPGDDTAEEDLTGDLLVARAQPGATAFDAGVEVADPTPGLPDQPKILVTPSGRALIAYGLFPTSGHNAGKVAWSDDGVAWQVATVSDEDGLRQVNSGALCQSGSRVYFVAERGDVTRYAMTSITLHWSDDGGVTWPAANETAISEPGDPLMQITPQCVAQGDTVWVVYAFSTDEPDTTARSPLLQTIRIARSLDAGATVADRGDAQDAAVGPWFLNPTLAPEPDGALDVFYYAGSEDGDEAGGWYRARAADGVTFAPAVWQRRPQYFTSRRDTVAWLGDYVGVAWDDRSIWTAYADDDEAYVHVDVHRNDVP